MPEPTTAKRWRRFGAPFQFSMLGAFMAQLLIFGEHPSGFSILQLPEYAGCILFSWCLWRLYVRKASVKGLITFGPFYYTRHPMYLSLLVMNVCFWVRVGVWKLPLFIGLESVFVICMILAAYCQERETLERFGQQAVDYYKRTPRIPFAPW